MRPPVSRSAPRREDLLRVAALRTGELLYGVVDGARHRRLAQEAVRLYDATRAGNVWLSAIRSGSANFSRNSSAKDLTSKKVSAEPSS